MSAGDGKTRKTVKYRPMKPDRWTPRVTVAAIVERDGQIVKSPADAPVDSEVTMRLAHGQLRGRVL